MKNFAKKLACVVAIFALWGCGPEQSAADRDQQQIESQIQAYKALYAPYTGTYTGTITYPQSGIIQQVSLNLSSTVALTNNVSTITDTPTPTVTGSFNTCLGNGCFDTDPNNTTYADTSVQVSFGNYDTTTSTLTLNTSQSGTLCSGLAAKNCAADTIDLGWTSTDHTGLKGNLKKAGSTTAYLILVRRQ